MTEPSELTAEVMAAEVMATERRWVQAHRDLDIAEIESILDDGYKRIQGDDTVIGKRDVIASYRSGHRRWDVAEGSDYTVQLVDDFAVIVGLWRGVGENLGEAFDYRARFLSIYVRRSSGWKLFRDEMLASS